MEMWDFHVVPLRSHKAGEDSSRAGNFIDGAVLEGSPQGVSSGASGNVRRRRSEQRFGRIVTSAGLRVQFHFDAIR
jgi:hypothetical protein